VDCRDSFVPQMFRRRKQKEQNRNIFTYIVT